MRAWLRELRTERGLTMKAVADKLGISESYYCEIENGNRQKKMDLMLASGLAVILDIPVAEIVKKEA